MKTDLRYPADDVRPLDGPDLRALQIEAGLRITAVADSLATISPGCPNCRCIRCRRARRKS